MCPHGSASLLIWKDNYRSQECRMGTVSMCVVPRCKAASLSERAWPLGPEESRMFEIRRLGQVLEATRRKTAASFCAVLFWGTCHSSSRAHCDRKWCPPYAVTGFLHQPIKTPHSHFTDENTMLGQGGLGCLQFSRPGSVGSGAALKVLRPSIISGLGRH